MATPIGIVSTIIIALAILMNGQEIIKTDNLSGDKNIDKITNFKIEENTTILVPEKEDIININLFGMNMYPSWGGKADERDLTNEYIFLKEIAETNDLAISRQMKIYIRDEEKREYSKFQENFIIYKEKNNNEDSTIELTFSENEFIEEKVPADGEWIKPSIIENQELQIFERQSLENEKNVTGKALFNIDGMNFRINIYNVSHEKFIKIIKTTIKEYKNFEKEKKEEGYTKLKDIKLYSEGTSLTELVKYDNKLYGRAFSEIDYGGNPNGPVGVIDKLIAREYIPIYNGETNTARFLNAKVDSATERRLILLAEEGAVSFERIYVQENLNTNKIIKPTEKEIIAMYEKAQEIYLWFIGNIPYEKFDYKNAIEDGIYPIKDERFSDIEELKEYLNHIFTKEIMEQLIEKIDKADLFFEINKKLYAKEYSLAKSIYSGEEVIKDIKYIDDNIIVITVLAEILDEDLINVKEQEEHNFKLIYDSGEWKFSEFYCIGF